MKKTKILVGGNILDKISSSTKLSDAEKVSFLRHIKYMTNLEQKELSLII